MKIAISGFNGFIGKHLCTSLEEENHDLIKISRTQGLDLSDSTILSKIPKFDLFIHLAANSFVPDSFNKPHEFYRNNILSTLNALELCKKYNAKFYFFSSYVYGRPSYLPIDENHPISSINPYAESKIICERLCMAYSRDFGVPVTIFRPFNIYGKGQNESFIIPTIIEKSKTGIVELKDSRPKRDFIHVKDIVVAILNAIKLNKEGVNIYNLGYGESFAISDIINIIKQVTKSEFRVSYSEERRPNEVLDTVSNIDKAKKDLGWTPKIDLLTGIKDILSI